MAHMFTTATNKLGLPLISSDEEIDEIEYEGGLFPESVKNWDDTENHKNAKKLNNLLENETEINFSYEITALPMSPNQITQKSSISKQQSSSNTKILELEAKLNQINKSLNNIYEKSEQRKNRNNESSDSDSNFENSTDDDDGNGDKNIFGWQNKNKILENKKNINQNCKLICSEIENSKSNSKLKDVIKEDYRLPCAIGLVGKHKLKSGMRKRKLQERQKPINWYTFSPQAQALGMVSDYTPPDENQRIIDYKIKCNTGKTRTLSMTPNFLNYKVLTPLEYKLLRDGREKRKRPVLSISDRKGESNAINKDSTSAQGTKCSTNNSTSKSANLGNQKYQQRPQSTKRYNRIKQVYPTHPSGYSRNAESSKSSSNTADALKSESKPQKTPFDAKYTDNNGVIIDPNNPCGCPVDSFNEYLTKS